MTNTTYHTSTPEERKKHYWIDFYHMFLRNGDSVLTAASKADSALREILDRKYL